MRELPQIEDEVREAGFLRPDERTLVMFSGGGDSVATLALAVRVCGAPNVLALHVNYGLRGAESEADEAFCAELCERFGVRFVAERVEMTGEAGEGNLHDRARAARYELAEELAGHERCAAIATGHTADDQAETVLYRLLSSPGRRALLGMPRRRGKIVRPLLDYTREQLRAWCAENQLPWREDSANENRRFARARVRGALGELRALHPAAVRNVLATVNELAAEAAALDVVVGDLLAGALDDDGALRARDLAAMPEPLAALVLRRFVEESLERPVPAARLALGDVFAVAARGGSHTLCLEGARLLLEYDKIRVSPAGRDNSITQDTGTVELTVPGSVTFGEWSILAGAGAGETSRDLRRRGGSVTLPRDLAGERLTVRARRPGDRMRPLGLGGSKSLQDLFVDQKVPRRLRDRYPLVCAGEEILWIPEVAVGERLARGESVSAQAATVLHAARRR